MTAAEGLLPDDPERMPAQGRSAGDGTNAPHILLPFFDDTSVMFASAMKRLLQAAGWRVTTGWQTQRSALSYRQLLAHLPQGPDLMLPDTASYADLGFLAEFDAVAVCRMDRGLVARLKDPTFRHVAGRPCFMAFLPGLELTPSRGLQNRAMFDALFLVEERQRYLLRSFPQAGLLGQQSVHLGHPYFQRRPRSERARKDIYFFTQAISPATKQSRAFICRMLAAMARRHHDRRVVVKLRHLPEENTEHVHRERWSYPDLLERLPDRPANLVLSACGMAEAIEKASVALTCTSTAAIDTVGVGVPTMLYLDYPHRGIDALNAPTRAMFEGSGLVCGLDDILNLRAVPPNEDWLKGMFAASDLPAAMADALEQFRKRPVAVDRVVRPEAEQAPRARAKAR